MQISGSVREQYEAFLGQCGDSPTFVDWTRGVLGDPEVQAWISALREAKQQPNLVYAAARWHGVAAPGPFGGLRAALLDDDGSIRDTILSRATQTNEVGRLATLQPVFASVARQHRGAPLALVEAGASAGLCLYPDRWGYRWSTERGPVTLGEEPALRCEVSGPAPLGHGPLQVAWRGGVDLNPLDVTDADTVAWLRTLVWPEHEDRRALLARAVEVARAEPPHLVRGDLLERLPSVVAEAAAHGPVVVFHSAVIAYLADDDRERFHDLMAGLVADGACHWVSNEGARVLPRVTATVPGAPGEVERAPLPFVLGLDGRAVAWTHGHGRAMAWLG
ncbi:DUF2332 domain-containing protein [Nocardioides nanhaiensis]|uniref:DUF2332 domain-containing protein n=1 Tax=Nocardioides nanhaiensis TaxID=1476871 RepID=A0ABP8VP31_9ACTN